MIINSLLDQDMYKLTMMQVVLHQFPGAEVEYQFRCRNEGIVFSKEVFNRINEEIDHLCTVMLQPDEIDYLSSFRFFKKDYINFLKIFRLQREFVNVTLSDKGQLSITITGPWLHTILFEIFLLSIVNEAYFDEVERKYVEEYSKTHGKCRIPTPKYANVQEKVDLCNSAPSGFYWTEFGTRRRRSHVWQNWVLGEFKTQTDRMIGTSNLFFAKKHGLSCKGTMAHEYGQAGQGLGNVRLVDSQKFMFEAWVQEYRGDLGIALTDTLGLDAFLVDFDLYFAKLFDGVRQDSGDPYLVGEKIINHYLKLGIDPKTKIIMFSDGLTIPKALGLFNRFNGRIKVGFGIGTDIVNDVGFDPLNIVIKMTRCNDHPVAKISDSLGKCMCTDDNYIAYLRSVIAEKIRGL